MCGGSGTRLWPLSRQSCPKQFLTLFGDRSLLQSTVDRLDGLPLAVQTIVIGNEDYRFLMAEQLRSTSGAAEIVLEPEMRNTAPVALVAALRAQGLLGGDGLVLLSPADHIIADTAAFYEAIERAIPAAKAGYLVTFGINPTHAATGYGYIEVGGALPEAGGVARATSFREKPDRTTAEAFLASRAFLWNAGIFLFDPAALLTAAQTMYPRMAADCRASSDGARPDLDFVRLDAEAYARIETISFDHAFAEKLEGKVAVVPVTMGWSDIGSWSALYDSRVDAPEGNVVEGPAELFDCAGSLAFSDGPLVVAQGVRDLVVVANHDAVYVAPLALSEGVKDIVATLDASGRAEAVTHARVFRPWGWYQVINLGEGFQVKEIVVYPGGRLSLQSHEHRSEHWVVVRGTARVTVDEEVRTLHANESVYIPVHSRHRLENPGEAPMHLIEVQTGGYLEEDDIVRYEDAYGRE